MNSLLRVDVGSGSCSWEAFPQRWDRYGGRSLVARILVDEVPALAHALGPHNKFILALGLLGGAGVPTGGRLSVGAKSPLTGGAKESNIGGMAGIKLARCGVRSVVVQGTAPRGVLQALVVRPGLAELISVEELRGLGTLEVSRVLLERYRGAAVLTIGPAGELLLAAACVCGTDVDGRPSRQAGRGGMGAVMGAKGLKAIVIDDRDGGECFKPDDELKQLVREFAGILRADPQSSVAFPSLGTAMMVDIINGAGGLPTRAFRCGTFELADRINARALAAVIEARGGVKGHPCQKGCVIRCSNVFVGPMAEEVVAGFEYETIGLLGSNCGIGDLDDIAYLNRLCDDVGVDTIETGAALGLLMDQGIIPFGDTEAAARLITEAGRGTAMGRILGSGAGLVGRVFGSARAPCVKGQAMAAYDPRAYKGTGTSYATSPMGADHTAGNVLSGASRTDSSGQADLSIQAQLVEGLFDILGLCRFSKGPILSRRREILGELVSRVHGWRVTYDDLLAMVKEGLSLERQFNRAAGMGPADDRLPWFFAEEPLEPSGLVFDVSTSELDAVGAFLDGAGENSLKV